MEQSLMKYFSYDHLPARLQFVSEPFSVLALRVATMQVQDERERSVAMRRLLEAKDAAVRSVL